MSEAGHDAGPDRAYFLDGLRGWAALCVVLWHLFGEIFAYGPSAGATLGKLLLFDGAMPVCLFFMISGFSLSIGYVRSPDPENLQRLAWSRYPRLAIPIFLACLLVYLGMVSGFIPAPDGRPFPLNQALLFTPTFEGLLRFSFFGVFYDFSLATAYIVPLWTMRIELLGSAIVLLLLAVAGRHRWRAALYLVAFVAFWIFSPYLSLFVAGLIHAEFYARVSHVSRPIRAALWAAALLGCASTFFKTVEPSMPYILMVVGLLAAVSWLPPLRRFFESRFSRFLGHLSFPLYLIHAPVIYSLSLIVLRGVTPLGLGTAMTNIIVGLVSLAMAIAAAMAFAPLNDLAIRLSRSFGIWATHAVSRLHDAFRPPNAMRR